MDRLTSRDPNYTQPPQNMDSFIDPMSSHSKLLSRISKGDTGFTNSSEPVSTYDQSGSILARDKHYGS